MCLSIAQHTHSSAQHAHCTPHTFLQEPPQPEHMPQALHACQENDGFMASVRLETSAASGAAACQCIPHPAPPQPSLDWLYHPSALGPERLLHTRATRQCASSNCSCKADVSYSCREDDSDSRADVNCQPLCVHREVFFTRKTAPTESSLQGLNHAWCAA